MAQVPMPETNTNTIKNRDKYNNLFINCVIKRFLPIYSKIPNFEGVSRVCVIAFEYKVLVPNRCITDYSYFL